MGVHYFRNKHALKVAFLFVLLFITSFSMAQKSKYKGLPSLVWPKLYNIQYKKEKDFDKPIFSKETTRLANKVLSLPGYMVPFENGMKDSHFMLTSLPLNACFFCGVGGPETIVEVYLKKPIDYTDKPIEVKGKLTLNDTNPDKMIYILQEAEMLGEIDF